MVQIIYSIFLSLWRRWFGGGFKFLPDNRFLQHILGFLATFSVLLYYDHHWLQSVLVSLALQGLFFARSHGVCFDFGHGQPPDVERYNKMWYWKYVKKIIPESEWYSFSGDYILFTVRYTLPALLISILLGNIYFIFVGVLISCSYAFLWKLYDWKLVDKPTDKAEFLLGFITGFFLVI